MLRGLYAAAGHGVGLGGHETPWGSGEPEAWGQSQAWLCPSVSPTLAAERGQGAGCHALPHGTVPSLGSLMTPPCPRLDSALCFWGGGLQAKGHSGCTPLSPPDPSQPRYEATGEVDLGTGGCPVSTSCVTEGGEVVEPTAAKETKRKQRSLVGEAMGTGAWAQTQESKERSRTKKGAKQSLDSV